MVMSREEVRFIDPVLTKVVHGYTNEQMMGQYLFPTVFVPKSGVKMIKFGKEAFLEYETLRAAGSATQRVMFGYEGDPVALFQHALDAVVPREFKRDTKDIPKLDHASIAVNNIMEIMLLSAEREKARIAQDPNNYDINNQITLTATDSFVNPATDTLSIIEAAQEQIRSRTGRYPNVCILPAPIRKALRKNTLIKENFKYTSSRSITTEMLSQYWEIENVYSAKSITAASKNSAFSDIWDSIILAYVPPQDLRSTRTPSYGYNYVLEGSPLVEEPWFDKTVKSWIYGMEYERQPVLTGMDAGFLIRNPAAQ